jgi:acetate kinase
MLMKGSLHTDELMGEVVARDSGLRTGRRISHVYVMQLDGRETPLLITDAAINIDPTLEDKHDIIQNAIDLATLGVPQPKVAILAAVETVNPAMRSTMDAGPVQDGRSRPDHRALSTARWPSTMPSAPKPRRKGIVSPVAGQADILVVPNLEAGNMLAKQLTYLGGADAAGVVLGARVPIVLTSRADSLRTRAASSAVAVLLARSRAASRHPRRGRAMTPVSSVSTRVRRASSSASIASTPMAVRRAMPAGGKIEGIGTAPHLAAKADDGSLAVDRRWTDGAGLSHEELLAELIDWAVDHLKGHEVVGIGHRVVHGGRQFAAPVRIDEDVLTKLESLSALAPLHQPHNLAAIRAMAKLAPDVPQVATFDTAFHRGRADETKRFALPRAMYDRGIRRYGFHGLSYAWIARELARVAPTLAAGRVVVAHLGNGASLCAMHGGKSVDTTMGFTALDGLVMGTRCGTLDAGLVLHLIRHEGMDPADVETLFYQRSGLLGVSGISSDMRTLHESDALPRKRRSPCSRPGPREIAALATSMGGLDGVVFTAGIGENDPVIRAMIAKRLEFIGLAIDETANAANARDIHASEAGSRPWSFRPTRNG